MAGAPGEKARGGDAHAAALAYAARGWSPIPIEPRGKRPLVPWLEFQQRAATTDEIDGWFRGWPEANIGIVTGRISGLVVVDVDPRHGGAASLRRASQEHGPLPRTVEAATGGGGCRLYFAYPGSPVHNRAGLLPGIDLRADGGCVVALELLLTFNHVRCRPPLTNNGVAPVAASIAQLHERGRSERTDRGCAHPAAVNCSGEAAPTEHASAALQATAGCEKTTQAFDGRRSATGHKQASIPYGGVANDRFKGRTDFHRSGRASGVGGTRCSSALQISGDLGISNGSLMLARGCGDRRYRGRCSLAKRADRPARGTGGGGSLEPRSAATAGCRPRRRRSSRARRRRQSR